MTCEVGPLVGSVLWAAAHLVQSKLSVFQIPCHCESVHGKGLINNWEMDHRFHRLDQSGTRCSLRGRVTIKSAD